MAAAVRIVVVVYRLLEVVDVETGHWCHHCLLPSAAIITLASQIGDGPLRLSRGIHCFEGHGWIGPWSCDQLRMRPRRPLPLRPRLPPRRTPARSRLHRSQPRDTPASRR